MTYRAEIRPYRISLARPAAWGAVAGLAVTAACAQSGSGFVMPTIAPPAIPAETPWVQPSTTVFSANKRELRVQRVMNGRLLARGENVPGVVLADIEARDFGPILRGAGLLNARVERVSVSNGRADGTYGMGIVNLSGAIGDLVATDLVFAGDPAAPAPNGPDAWGAVMLKGKTASDTGTFSIDRFDFRNLYMAPGGAYANVDGISTESGHSGTITNGSVDGASDACLDLKGNVRVDNVRLANCREGLKIWSSQTHGLIEMGTNSFVAIIGKGNASGPVTIRIDRLVMTGDPSKPIFRAEDGVVNLTIGILVAKPEQVVQAASSFAGASVTIDQRVAN